MNVCVCISTYKRTAKLRLLLRSIADLEFVKRNRPDVRVVVVDNDPEGSAAEVVESMAAATSLTLDYVVEPRKGYAFSRNRAVDCSSDADFLAFVDDDEVVSPRWLDELLDVQVEYGADVVAGPTIPRYEESPPRWVLQGGFFERLRYETGAAVLPNHTGNVLIRRTLLNHFQPPFDPRLNLLGGEDTLLFSRLPEVGAKFAWSDAAIVYEWVPKERMLASWFARRAFRAGISLALCDRILRRSRAALMAEAARNVAVFALGVTLVVVSPVAGRATLVQGLRRGVRCVGYLLGLAGFVPRRYR